MKMDNYPSTRWPDDCPAPSRVFKRRKCGTRLEFRFTGDPTQPGYPIATRVCPDCGHVVTEAAVRRGDYLDPKTQKKRRATDSAGQDSTSETVLQFLDWATKPRPRAAA